MSSWRLSIAGRPEDAPHGAVMHVEPGGDLGGDRLGAGENTVGERRRRNRGGQDGIDVLVDGGRKRVHAIVARFLGVTARDDDGEFGGVGDPGLEDTGARTVEAPDFGEVGPGGDFLLPYFLSTGKKCKRQ